MAISHGSMASLGNFGRELWKLESIYIHLSSPTLKLGCLGITNAPADPSWVTQILSIWPNEMLHFTAACFHMFLQRLQNLILTTPATPELFIYHSTIAFTETRAAFKRRQIPKWGKSIFQPTEPQLSRRIWPGCTACVATGLSAETNAASARSKGSESISIKLKPKGQWTPMYVRDVRENSWDHTHIISPLKKY